MGELIFVGLGLYDERDLSLRAWEELSRCATILVEQYTSRWGSGAVERLSQRLGKPVEEITREELEGERTVLAELTRVSPAPVALLVVGEPFAATTHVALRLAVEAQGHRWKVVHNASILTAAASLAGLSHYKFGRTVSLPRPREGFRPTSPYEGLQANWDAGLHTLVLLDLDPAENSYVDAATALRELGALEEERKGGVLPPERLVVVVARAGAPDAAVWAGPRGELQVQDFGPPLHCVIVPGPTLHFIEKEALRALRSPRPPGRPGTVGQPT